MRRRRLLKFIADISEETAEKLWKHLRGEVSIELKAGVRKKTAKGIHTWEDVVNGNVKLKDGSVTLPPNPLEDEPFIGRVQMKDPDISANWIKKNNSTIRIEDKQMRDATSFFPKNWKMERIQEEIAIAWDNRKFIEKKIQENGMIVESFRGRTSTGFEIEFINNDGILKTAAPFIKL